MRLLEQLVAIGVLGTPGSQMVFRRKSDRVDLSKTFRLALFLAGHYSAKWKSYNECP